VQVEYLSGSDERMKNGIRILVVEDDRSIARLVQLELVHRDFVVRCAHDGPSGLEAISEFRPAAVVLDIMLPKVDGVGVLKRRRGTRCR
jgi:DNA-binding response OmpR family regulator